MTVRRSSHVMRRNCFPSRWRQSGRQRRRTMSSVRLIWLTLTAAVAVLGTHAGECAEDLPATAKILDPDLLLYSWPFPIVSPDGERVAYISRGFVCDCRVDG